MAPYFYDGSVENLADRLERLVLAKQRGTLHQEAAPANERARAFAWPQQGARLDATIERVAKA